MLISFCTPCMNRIDDLKITMPYRIASANAFPPIQIAVADYNSTDGLQEYMHDLMSTTHLEGGSFFTYRKYTGRNTWHMAHGFNLAMLLGKGDYLVATAADHYPELGYIPVLHSLIEQSCIWMTGSKLKNMIAIQQDEFIAMGGYDEQFEFYGPEDLDLQERLTRRGGKFGLMPLGLIGAITTPEKKKLENYRIKAEKKGELSNLMLPYLYENRNNNVLVANPNGWGKWE